MHRDSLQARRRYTRLAGSADSLALARLVPQTRPLAVLTATALDAQRLLEETAWFAPGLRACLLPDWETLPYDQFSPHQDLVSERLDGHIDSRFTIDGDHLDAVVGILHAARIHTLTVTPPSLDELFLRTYAGETGTVDATELGDLAATLR